jgi:hypothetical protein
MCPINYRNQAKPTAWPPAKKNPTAWPLRHMKELNSNTCYSFHLRWPIHFHYYITKTTHVHTSETLSSSLIIERMTPTWLLGAKKLRFPSQPRQDRINQTTRNGTWWKEAFTVVKEHDSPINTDIAVTTQLRLAWVIWREPPLA